MAAERSSLKRKPLSDCINTIASHATSVRRKPSFRSALNQPPISSSENNNEAPTGSLKSNTSTGSNNPPISTSVHSTLLPASRESEKQDRKKWKDKGKAVVEDTTVLQLEPPTPSPMKLSSATALDLSENQETKKRKDKGKAVIEDTRVLQPEPPTPLIRKLSSATASGGSVFPDSLKCRTVYTRKRFPEARNLKSLKITEPFSCPPLNRVKDKGKQVGDGGGDGESRMRRDLFPAYKKQPRAKAKREEAVDAMRKEEVEKLRAYYADIDAFELEVEKASDNDLE